MAGPLAAVLGGLVTFYLAAATSDGLVADDYYKRGLAINQVIRRTTDAARRGILAEVSFDEANHSVRVALLGEVPADPAPLLRLTHPTRSGGDQIVPLRRSGAGDYLGELRLPAQGRWHVTLENPQWRVTGTWQFPGEISFQLVPGGDPGWSGRDPARQGKR